MQTNILHQRESRRGHKSFRATEAAVAPVDELLEEDFRSGFERDGVKYARLLHDLPAYNKAGEHLRLRKASQEDFDVVGNWRAAHAYPLVIFRQTLSARGRRIDRNVLIAQRLKRLTSIAAKLNRFRHLRLRDIQDIGGCRAVLSSQLRARRLFKRYLDGSLAHELLWDRDYVKQPKESGYRGYHLIYAFKGQGERVVFDDLRIEIQIRSRLQHAWATAVETVDIFTGQALKSSLGAPDWERFFRLMASYIASRERSPLVPNTPTDRADLVECVRECETKMLVRQHLRSFRHVAERFDNEAAFRHETTPSYFLLEVQPFENRILVEPYKSQDLPKAEKDYLNTEQGILAADTQNDAVLVSVERLVNLRRAYPNYYGDTEAFLRIVEDALHDR